MQSGDRCCDTEPKFESRSNVEDDADHGQCNGKQCVMLEFLTNCGANFDARFHHIGIIRKRFLKGLHDTVGGLLFNTGLRLDPDEQFILCLEVLQFDISPPVTNQRTTHVFNRHRTIKFQLDCGSARKIDSHICFTTRDLDDRDDP